MSAAASGLFPGQPGAGGRELCPADGHQQGEAAPGEQEQWGQCLLAGVVGQGSYRHQLV
jgi:hypothetical protein